VQLASLLQWTADQTVFSTAYIKCLLQAAVERAVEALGGTYTRNLDHSTTHLVAASTSGAKYAAAVAEQVQIVTADWALDCEKQQYQLPEADYAVPVFLGAIVCTTGLSLQRRAATSELVRLHGGSYQGHMDETVTHLVADAPEGAKYEAAVSSSTCAAVGASWLEACVAARKRVPEVQHPVPTAAPPDYLAEAAALPESGALSGCRVMLLGFLGAQGQALTLALRKTRATRHAHPHEALTHIVVGDVSLADRAVVTALIEHPRHPAAVTPQWLMDSAAAQKALPPRADRYRARLQLQGHSASSSSRGSNSSSSSTSNSSACSSSRAIDRSSANGSSTLAAQGEENAEPQAGSRAEGMQLPFLLSAADSGKPARGARRPAPLAALSAKQRETAANSKNSSSSSGSNGSSSSSKGQQSAAVRDAAAAAAAVTAAAPRLFTGLQFVVESECFPNAARQRSAAAHILAHGGEVIAAADVPDSNSSSGSSGASGGAAAAPVAVAVDDAAATAAVVAAAADSAAVSSQADRCSLFILCEHGLSVTSSNCSSSSTSEAAPEDVAADDIADSAFKTPVLPAAAAAATAAAAVRARLAAAVRSGSAEAVSPTWLATCVNALRVHAPTAWRGFAPLPRPLQRFAVGRGFSCSVSLYEGADRAGLSELAVQCGAEYDARLQRNTTHLLCAAPKGPK
jgi:twin BRCT domain